MRFTLRYCGAAKEAELRHGSQDDLSSGDGAGACLAHARRADALGRRSLDAAKLGRDDGPFAVDVLTQPESNPWLCQMRLTGLDFLPGRQQAVLCTWDGDVWQVGGIDDRSGILSWRRIASGLFQPLGIKVVDGSDLRLLPRSDRDSARC